MSIVLSLTLDVYFFLSYLNYRNNILLPLKNMYVCHVSYNIVNQYDMLNIDCGPVIIAARLYVKSGSIGEFKRLAAPLIEATRQEKGCLQYDLYQDISDSTAFFFYEVYADRDAQELHSGSEYLARFIREREPLVCDESEVNVYDAEIRKQLK